MKMVLGTGAALALALAAGTASAQCTTYIRTTGAASIVPGDTDIGNHGDDVTTNVALPFPVTVYGVSYNSVNVCSNGWISFTATNTGYANVCLANNTGAPDFDTVPGVTVFGHWDDLSTTAAGNGIFISTTGAPGSRQFHIEWRAARLASAASRVDMEMRLFEGTPRIEIHYGNISEGGFSATSGIQQDLGTFDQYSCNETVLTNGLMVAYSCDLTNPSASGAATPGTQYQGRPVLLAVSATPAQTPPSTGLTARVDLSSWGGSATQTLFDNGTNGDVTAGDNVFSYATTVPPSQGAGQSMLPFLVTDAQSRTAPGTIVVNVLQVPAAGEWVEAYHNGGDVQDLPGTAATVDLSGDLMFIKGNLSLGDADMFKVHMCTPGSFSASTVGNGNTVDTQLFVFRADGTGVVMDDDDPTAGTTHLQSLLSSTFTASLPAGDYYFAISQWDKDPFDASNQQIWLDTIGGSYRVEHAPDDVGAANPIAMWNATAGVGGAYTIAVTGLSGASCGPVCGTADFNGDGDFGTDQDIEAFFACLSGNCCATCLPDGADFNRDGDFGTDQDIESFFRVLSGAPC